MDSRLLTNKTRFSDTLLSQKKRSIFHKIYYWVISIPWLYKYKTKIKYASVGLSGEIVDFLVLFILTSVFNVFYLLSTLISYICAVFVNFNFQKRYTFKYRTSGLSDYFNSFFRFFAISITGLIATIILMVLLVSLINLHYILAKLITGVVVFILNFNGHSSVLSKPKLFRVKK